MNIKTNITFFADDTKLYCNALKQYSDMKDDLAEIQTWSERWQMKLNADKCVVLPIGPENPENEYVLNGCVLQHVDSQKDLGILVSSDLKWEKHITTIVKKANSFSYLARIAFSNTSPQMISELYKTYIWPKIEYAHSLWSPYFLKDINLLEGVQRRFSKIPQQFHDTSYEDRMKALHLISLEERRTRLKPIKY